MPAKSKKSEQPVTQAQWKEGMEMIEGFLGKLLHRADTTDAKVGSLERRMNERDLKDDLRWKKQESLNKEVLKTLALHTSMLESLDKKIRYQEDAPERLEHVENTTYDLQRRVTILEQEKQ